MGRANMCFPTLMLLAFTLVGSALGQTTAPLCEPCITVDPVEPGIPDELSGVYRFLELDPECPGSCSYTRDGQGEDQVYCFGPGPRTGAFECPAVTGSSTGAEESTISTSSSSPSVPPSTSSAGISTSSEAPSSPSSSAGSTSGSSTLSSLATSSASSTPPASSTAQSTTVASSSASSAASSTAASSSTAALSSASSSSVTSTVAGSSTAPSTTGAATTTAAPTTSTATTTVSTTAKCPEFTGTETCPPGWSQYGLKCYQMQAPTIPLSQT